ncbi:MAG: tetratricopeptide repeat protein [Bdellovibrionales bacterium]|nr:tetratricopeptide repeat protein [Bdellovibrionales bacterium]
MSEAQVFGRIYSVFALALGLALAGCSSSGPKRMSDEERARAHLAIGDGALNEGDFTGALIEYDKAEKLNPKLPELHHSKALAYMRRGDLPTAVRCARAALDLRPSSTDARNTLGKLLVDQGQTKEAQKHLEQAAADPLYRDAFKPLSLLGMIAYRAGNQREAEHFFGRAIQLDPRRACVAYYYRGNIRVKSGDMTAALDDYDRAVMNACGSFAEAHYAKALALSRAGQFDDARKKFVEVTKLFPKHEVANQARQQLRVLP